MHTGITLWARVEKTLVRFSHILRSSIFILGHLYKEKLIFPGREDTIYSYYDNIHAGEYIEYCTEIPKIAVKHQHNAISSWYLNTGLEASRTWDRFCDER